MELMNKILIYIFTMSQNQKITCVQSDLKNARSAICKAKMELDFAESAVIKANRQMDEAKKKLEALIVKYNKVKKENDSLLKEIFTPEQIIMLDLLKIDEAIQLGVNERYIFLKFLL